MLIAHLLDAIHGQSSVCFGCVAGRKEDQRRKAKVEVEGRREMDQCEKGVSNESRSREEPIKEGTANMRLTDRLDE